MQRLFRPPSPGRERASALASDLRDAIDGEVRFDDGSRAQYSTDASNYRQVPIGVVVPASIDDIVATVDTCHRHGAPILSRGAGTSLAGQACNHAVVIDSSKYVNRVIEVDFDQRRARVEPGTILDDLRDATEDHGLTFGPDPATHNRCTFGGMLGNNSCGVHSVVAGRTSENVEALEVLTYDGTRLRVGPTSDDDFAVLAARAGRVGDLYRGMLDLRTRYGDLVRSRFPDIPRRVSGYALDELLPERGGNVARALVGSEGTLVTILEATVRLVPQPPKRVLAVLGYADIYRAADHVPDILAHGPMALEGMDEMLVEDMRRKGLHVEDVGLLPEGRAWMLVEFGGDTAGEAAARARHAIDDLNGDALRGSKVFEQEHDQAVLWTVRESGLAATARVPGDPDTWPGWEDAAVHPARLGDYLRDFRRLLVDYGYEGAFYGHFGQGCVHTRITFDLLTAPGVKTWRRFLEDAADLVVEYGGSLSGEHGDGQARAELLGKMYGPELVEAFARFKALWDPDGKMNPGKVVDPYRVDEHLRLGPGYEPKPLPTHFRFPHDDGSLARATLRCVGVGECRRLDGGTMCPSFMVTREEQHSTRGRARVLFEMINGRAITDGWRSEHVKEALDLCLACKGCKSDCPVNVDIATYKAEFLSHYYARRVRPRAAYSMGLVMFWARLAAHAPRLANRLAQAPRTRSITNRIAGVAPQRQLPRFADRTFRGWFNETRRERTAHGEPVVLWTDTFTNHFSPEVARAAVAVLEDAGFDVRLSPRGLCCGRPLYDFGFLGQAKRQLRAIVDAFDAEIEHGVPIVVLEPSCAAVFRDELVNLFANDLDAHRLSAQTFDLAGLLARHAPGWRPPALEGRALVQAHCHHGAVLGFEPESELLATAGLDAEVLDSGCCGMAGAFGFEPGDKYEVSIACGERVLLPAVRAASDDMLVIADGFSCREQIRQQTGRRGLHVAEVFAKALEERGQPRSSSAKPVSGSTVRRSAAGT